MNEKAVANKIRETIRTNKNNVLEVVIQNFADMWFRGRKFSDTQFTKKLINFAKTYDFDYVLILNQHKIATVIRFWEKGSQIESKEKENAVHREEVPTSDGRDSTTDEGK